MSKRLTVKISKDCKVSCETFGISGNSCSTIMDQIQSALLSTGEVTHKPEFYETEDPVKLVHTQE